MTEQQRCQQAATAPACPEKGAALQLTPHHLELIRAAAEACQRVLNPLAIGPELEAAHSDWLNAAESLAVAIIHQAEREARQ